MKKLLLLLGLCCLLTGCGRDLYKVPNGLTLQIEQKKFPVYENHTLEDLILQEDIEIINKKDKLISDKIGTHKITMDYKYKKKKYKYDLKYIIEDREAPFLISYPGVKTVLKNDDFYPCDNVVFIDNYDREPTCTIDGNYDLTTTGVYNVFYVVSDASKNEVRKKLKINVVDKIATSPSKPSTPTEKKNLLFSDVITKYKNDTTMIGIDVSRWQGEIDWEKVKNAGVEFVILRMAVQSGINKEISMDSYFEKNLNGAKEVGLPIGVYIYSTATSPKVAIEHAKWAVNHLKGEKLFFPIAFDWENWKYINEYKISIHDLDEAFSVFREEVKKAGYDALLYSSKYYLENIWNNIEKAPVWLAHYTNETTYKGDYILWQLSNIGKVDGINTDVDINIYYKK